MIRSMLFRVAPLAFLVLAACETSGVGDPCVPQAIPEGGYTDQDVTIETTSVMCRTRVCLAYKFTGDPTREIIGPDENTCDPGAAADAGSFDDAGNLVVTGDPLCRTREYIREHMYCSCRCGHAGDQTLPLCDCPSGFTCASIQQGGGTAVEGSYCIRNSDVSEM